MEKILKIKVGSSHKGERLDKFLTEHLAGNFSRSFIQRLIKNGSVLLDGEITKSHYKLKGEESICLTVPEPAVSSIEAEDIPIDIVYEDDNIIVIDKPAGMVVHPAPGNYTGTLVNALLAHCKKLSGIGGVLKPGIVHRIDKGTSGILVAAKDDRSHRDLAKQFKDKTVKRVYIALASGVMELDNGIIELPIGRSLRDRKKMAVRFEETRSALTRYKVLKRFKNFTLVELVLGTGRTHQIRVHMSHIGYPILGDDKYGTTMKTLARPALHARTLGFVHPVTKKYMEFTREMPEDMRKVMEA